MLDPVLSLLPILDTLIGLPVTSQHLCHATERCRAATRRGTLPLGDVAKGECTMRECTSLIHWFSCHWLPILPCVGNLSNALALCISSDLDVGWRVSPAEKNLRCGRIVLWTDHSNQLPRFRICLPSKSIWAWSSTVLSEGGYGCENRGFPFSILLGQIHCQWQLLLPFEIPVDWKRKKCLNAFVHWLEDNSCMIT